MASKNDKHLQPSSGDHAAPKPHHGNPFVYFGTVVILIITVIAFVVAPSMGSGGGSGSTLSFGSWNGKAIAFAQGGYFADQVQQVKNQMEAQGYTDNGDQYFAYQVWRRAFENTAIHFALLDISKESGMAISEGSLDAKMAQDPAFVENGAFSRRKYREASASYKSNIRSSIRDSYMKDRFVADTVSVFPSTAETDFIKSMALAQRSVEYVAFPFSAYPDSAKLDFARNNAASFRKIRLSRITITSNVKEAGEVLSRVKAGSLSFEDAAKNYSKDAVASKGGDLGSRYAWELKGDFKDATALEAVFRLPLGAFSEVYESVSGSWVFYRIDDTVSEPEYASADLVRTVTEYINRYEKGLIEDYAVKTAEDFAAAAQADFVGTAASRSLSVKSTNSFPLNYGAALDLGYFSLLGKLDTTGNPELAGADRNEKFLQTVFSLKAAELSAPVLLNDYAIVMRVKEISNADESALGLISAYYSGVLQESISRELAEGIMKDPKLKDNFMDTFLRVFSPAN